MEFLIIGVVSALNLIVIVHKLRKGRIEHGLFDLALFAGMALLFSGSYAGMVVAMIASLIISIYLLINPPTFIGDAMNSETVKETLHSFAPKDSKVNESFKFVGWGLAFAAIVLASFAIVPALLLAGLVLVGGGIYKVLTANVDVESVKSRFKDRA